MKSKVSKLPPGAWEKNMLWIASWLFLVALSLDFYNWGRIPDLILGIPLWLWAEVCLIFLIALTFGILARFSWDEDVRPEESRIKNPGSNRGSGVRLTDSGRSGKGEEGGGGFE